jgi:hypothetical protein
MIYPEQKINGFRQEKRSSNHYFKAAEAQKYETTFFTTELTGNDHAECPE